MCLDWYYQQPDPSTWDRTLGTCACGFDQGRTDNSYSRRGKTNSLNANMRRLPNDILEDIEDMEGDSFCLQTTLANENGAGMHCCYRDDHSFVEGYETLWLSSFVVRHQYVNGNSIDDEQYQNWLDDDLLPRYYCCAASEDPAFCGYYQEKRPAGSCDGYLPPRTGWMFGDPHMRTLDGYSYTFNGMGEFTLIEFNHGMFELQGRMERAWSDGDDINGTVFTAFAAKVQGSTTVEITLNDDRSNFYAIVNGTEYYSKANLTDVPYFSENDPNFYLEVDSGNFTNVNLNASDRIVAYWSIGVSISVAMTTPGVLDIFFEIPQSYQGNQTQGLFGVWNDDYTDDFLLRNGSELAFQDAQNLTDRELYVFGQSWRVSEVNSLFMYDQNITWFDLNDFGFMPVFFDELLLQYENNSLLFDAEMVCDGDETCLFDALATKSISVGLGTRRTNSILQDDAQGLSNFPPNITNVVTAEGGTDRKILAQVGIESEITVQAYDRDGDIITYDWQYTLLNTTSPAKLSNTAAVFRWTPYNADRVRLGFSASDGRGISVAETDVLLCDCKNGGTCDFSSLADGSNLVEDKFAMVTCICPPAWAGDDCSEDYDGCLDSPCYPGVTCKDSVAPDANVTCGPCPPGLIGTGFKCWDFDECFTSSNNTCQQSCLNMLGSYDCECSNGYELHPDGSNCLDIDECDRGTDLCDPDFSLCTNTYGGYNCTCQDGFTDVNGDGTLCEDEDECRYTDFPCSPQATCSNQPGSFQCSCLDGFEGNGFVCTDVDECTRGLFTCGNHAICQNIIGSYFCSCEEGWEGDGTICTDINECKRRSIGCHPRALCENTNGSFICTCPDGYIGDGVTCLGSISMNRLYVFKGIEDSPQTVCHALKKLTFRCLQVNLSACRYKMQTVMKRDTLLSLAGPEMSIAVSFIHCAVGIDRSCMN
ncbi:putative fibrillin-1 [Apostichopus japonicus]|uniref:Putative fibrillin-1 n=1 Tax=Stichopus japonicus TaxID=307972 RepID=A0A2G8JF59_STIJA|nr:putative fibrillin-1 [Apostichopus japonicus]